MTLVQQRIFGGFSLKLKNKCGAQNSIKEKGDEEERGGGFERNVTLIADALFPSSPFLL